MKKNAGVKRILIAEDERPLAKALDLKLANSGFEVVVSVNGEEALSQLSEGRFDALLLDLMMPKVDGFGVLEAMKKRGDKTPVIVLTNLSQPEDERRTIDLGAKKFFVKADTPIASIISEIKNLLGEI